MNPDLCDAASFGKLLCTLVVVLFAIAAGWTNEDR
jgi:hypothetical protein